MSYAGQASAMSKTKAGFLYKESFGQPNPMWQKDPLKTDKIRVNPFNFELLPGDEIVRYITEAPAREFVMQAHFAHQPLSYDNFAGIVVLCDDKAFIECTTYRDQSTEFGAFVSYHSWIKVIKKDFRYTFYGSIDGKHWALVGSSLSRGSLIGFFLRCVNTNEKPFRIDNIEFYASNLVTFYGTRSFYRIILYDAAGAIVYNKEMPHGTTQYDLDTTPFILPMKDYRLKVLDSNDGIVFNETVTLQGGDVYELQPVPIRAWLNRDKQANYDGLLLNNENNDFDLGRLEDVFTYHTITIETETVDAARDINVYIQPFLYNSHVSDLVWLAPAESEDEPVGNVPDERWVRRVNIREIEHLKPKKVFMRIQKDFTQVMLFDTSRYKFKLIIES